MIPCDSDADCYEPYETCEQRDPGAFDRAEATYLYTFGTPAGDTRDRAQHAVTLSGAFCTPATFTIADPQACLPGPGSVALTGKLQPRSQSPGGAFVYVTSDAARSG